MANSFTVNTYSPKDLILTIGGYTVTGWEKINISRRTKSFQTVPGIRGKHTRTASQDTSATLSFTLLQTTQSNDVLSAIQEQDNINKTGRLSITLKDISGTSIFSSDEGYLTSYPAVSYSGTFEYRTWEIFLQRTSSYIIAGNSRPTTNLFDSAFNAATSFVNDLF